MHLTNILAKYARMFLYLWKTKIECRKYKFSELTFCLALFYRLSTSWLHPTTCEWQEIWVWKSKELGHNEAMLVKHFLLVSLMFFFSAQTFSVSKWSPFSTFRLSFKISQCLNKLSGKLGTANFFTVTERASQSHTSFSSIRRRPIYFPQPLQQFIEPVMAC